MPPDIERPAYSIQPFPLARRVIVDANRLGRRRRTIYGLLEFDVTAPRRRIAEHKAHTGEALSFTAYLAHCLALAVAEHPQVHALRDWRGRLVTFEDVDIAVVIDIELEGRRFPMGHILRRAQRRTFRELHAEIRAVQADARASASRRRWPRLRAFFRLPVPLRDLVYLYLYASPWRAKQHTGTVGLTALGMFAEMGGWGINSPTHNCSVVAGGIQEKPVARAGRVVVREILNLTLAVNHDVVDGIPAARFASRFKELVERGEW
ncbi:MAG: 2-oxo acid dehydrogenase subunit E2 [Chloroflexi bacterium]|nr:2-oxo acid dehydrogenase subunit E2 [Chloroflexota bacterium]